MYSETLRLIANLIQLGTITETKSEEGKLLAKVKVDVDRETDFFPVVGFANSFKREASPVRVGEQVIVFCPGGEANFGFIIRAIFNTNCKEPNGLTDTKEEVEYEDGTIISYDSSSKEISINCVGTVKVVCINAELSAQNTVINSTTTHNGNVKIDGILEVTKLIQGGDGISITGGAGVGGASFDCDISVKNINASGSITDSQGNLTNHTNNGESRD